MPDSIEARVARVDERQIAQGETLKAILDELKEASAGRRRMYEAQERTEREIIGMKHRLDGVEKSVADIRPTTADVEKMRERAIGAGTLGRWLWAAGGWIVGAAAALAAAYTWLTGRPPP